MTQIMAFVRRLNSWVLLAPRNLVIALLRGYRAVISPLYGQVCKYYPSCSAYAMRAVAVHGVCKGSLLTAWRLLRCNPWSHGGIDDVPPARSDRYAIGSAGFVRVDRGEEG